MSDNQPVDYFDDDKDDLSVEDVILESYIRNFVPYKKGADVVYKTSADIQGELSDMCIIDISTISKYMFHHNFKIVLGPDRKPTWVMSLVNLAF